MRMGDGEGMKGTLQRHAGHGVFRDCGGKLTVAAVWSMWMEEWPEMKLDADRLVELLNFMLSSGFRL